MGWLCGTCGGENQEGMKFCGHCGAAAGTISSPSVPVPDRPSTEADVSEVLRGFVSQQVADHLVASGGDITEERRLVTALFADISGFTPLADRLDPEELLEVIDPIIQRLTNIVGRYEGYVDKFAGDALLAFFGAPIAHEDDAQRALNVALEMHEEIRIKSDWPPDAGELTLHIGVNSGRVVARVLGTDVRMDYSVLGDAVILAQRLESAAPAGETYVGETTHRLTSDDFEFESVGELVLKGKAEKVSAFKLSGRKQRRAPGGGGFVGREQELHTIDAVLDSLTQGTGSVVSISGDPGVGKSRLTQEVKQRAESRGARWLVTRCLSYGQGIAYWPIADLFRRLAGISYNDPPERALPRLQEALEIVGLGASVPVLARLLGLSSPELDDLEPEGYRRLLHETIISAVRHISQTAPVVIVVEDLHWADASSVALVSDLASICDSESLVLYLTARAEALGVLVQIASGTTETLRHAIQLDPMDAPLTAPLIEGVLGAPPSPRLTEVINERAVGNPFFVRELVRALQDAGDIAWLDGQWELSPSFDATHVPPTIEGVLSARIDRLPRPLVGTLQVSSVIGRRVQVPLLSAVHANRNLKSHLEGLVAAGLLERSTEDEDELVFHHALVQDVAYSRLLRKRRRELHLKVAEAAERLYGAGDDSIDLLARHLHLAEAGDKAIQYLVRAGERAKRLFANDEALIHLGHAADLARLDESKAAVLNDVLIKIAEIQELRGSYEDAFRLYEEVRDTANLPRAWQGMAASLRNRSEYAAAHALLDQAFAQDFPPQRLPELWLERGWVYSREGHFAEAIKALSEGIITAADRQDGVVAHLHMQLTRAATVTGDPKDALRHALASVLIFEELDDLTGFSTAMRILGDAYRNVDLLDDAAEALERGLSLAERTGNVEEKAGCLINLGMVHLARSSIEEAIECDQKAIQAFESIGHSSGKAIAYGNLAEKLLAAGRYEDVIAHAAIALEVAGAIGHQPTIADVTQTMAAVYERQGDHRRAAEEAQAAAAIHLEMDALPAARRSLEFAADAYEQAGDTDEARATRARASSLATNGP
jgi:class 3 adenylate cyclase/tetratricopeptide (TPR) repeat protein